MENSIILIGVFAILGLMIADITDGPNQCIPVDVTDYE